MTTNSVKESRPLVSRRALLTTTLLASTAVLSRMFSQFANASAASLFSAAIFPPDEGLAPIAPTLRVRRRRQRARPVGNEEQVFVNQVGYLREDAKRGVVPVLQNTTDNSFCIVDDATRSVQYKGLLEKYGNGTPDGDCAIPYYANFDAFRTPGRYRVSLPDGRMSPVFAIGTDLYASLIPLMFRYFDMQQCGESDPKMHGPCHLDDGRIVDGPRNGERIEASGGWHDAGDYMKFVETTSYVTALMLFAYDQFPHCFAEPDADSVPPLLAHAKIGLDWLLKMHPAPDEFYYQVGDESDHETWRLPDQDRPACNPEWKPRPVYYGIGANLSGRTAAALAMASRLYVPFDPSFAKRCLQAALSVYALGLQNPRVLTTLPDDFYPEKTWEDDMEWGAVALFEATGDRNYLQQAYTFAQAAGAANATTSVYDTHAFAHYSLYSKVSAAEQRQLLAYLRTDVDYVVQQAQNPYELGTPYMWGTAEGAAGAALNCLLYTRLCSASERWPYIRLAQRQRDFILGCNPFGTSYLIGAGTRYPRYPHHPIADINHCELQGALVGGPSDPKTFREEHIDLEQSELPGHQQGPESEERDQTCVYHDDAADYVCNEAANDYTAKFLLLTAFYADV